MTWPSAVGPTTTARSTCPAACADRLGEGWGNRMVPEPAPLVLPLAFDAAGPDPAAGGGATAEAEVTGWFMARSS